MKLEKVVETITASLKQDEMVQAIFLKGSMGRGEHDEHSDIDMYCLVNEKDVEAFNRKRIDHLESYGKLLFHDDIFIIAPQILAVYEDLIHIDLFTVTEQTYIEKDFIKVLYDSNNHMNKYTPNQNLELSENEFQDAVDDVAWFLFQYKKSSDRGNDIWSVNMLHHVMTHLSKVLLQRYTPKRAQLGMKTFEKSLPKEVVDKIHLVFEYNTPQKHKQAVSIICEILTNESEWIFLEVANPKKIKPLWEYILTVFP